MALRPDVRADLLEDGWLRTDTSRVGQVEAELCWIVGLVAAGGQEQALGAPDPEGLKISNTNAGAPLGDLVELLVPVQNVKMAGAIDVRPV